jgi:uncharacterized membrane protein
VQRRPSVTWQATISTSLKLKRAARYLLGAAFIAAGANHFRDTTFYVSIMPAYLPWHTALVYISGVAEMVLGALLFVRPIERLAAWGVFALMIAVFPANLQMALHTGLYPQFSALVLWLRIPFQFVLLAWAYWLTRPDSRA